MQNENYEKFFELIKEFLCRKKRVLCYPQCEIKGHYKL